MRAEFLAHDDRHDRSLIVWSLLVDAPLEEPANPTRTPNPSKAPWYFLGLQEMLVFFDPWHAGVVLPSFIIVGLMVIPYIDINPKGNGYYCLKDRKWEILTFIFGFHILWVSLIIIGTFLRGPGWNWFWFWETWDPHKVEALTNVDLPYLLGVRDYWLVGDVRPLAAIGAYLRRRHAVGMYAWVFSAEGPGVHGALGHAALLHHGVPLPQHAGGGDEDAHAPRVQHQVRAGDAVDQHLGMFYLAKVLQALGLADVGYALFVGITRNLHGEGVLLTLIGLGVFSLGRALERTVA